MNALLLNRQPVFSIPAILSLICLGCFLLTVSGCEQASDQKVIPESSTTVNQPEVETSVPPASQQVSQTVISDRVEGQQVAVLLEIPHQQVKPGASFPVTVKFDIAPLWEIRSLEAQPENVATQLKLELPDGFETQGDWQTPPTGRSQSADSHPVYSGQVEFQQMILVTKEAQPGEYEISSQVQYQACDEFRCLSPTQKRLHVTILVDRLNSVKE
ncbi:protein-disulfide reductase DsbD family protein [Gimesia maris]|uniref:Thiol:disulfide interchange protein DsbD N-terminal domain-containing protein n=1 Tax=Gimesia maris TaxID=122 RepID=A0ABX5YQ97_9PLAN|nr:protein-disulfide reductase DsbD family protein [Gimesia maris]EDL59705.1 hypothetical protein PM8797T_24881 [Gimesia maris DSM 8797]QEG17939.1 hypothetical protein GmarT_38230 [Gimesia maris]QGQ29036.1 hypothetical protein F1729_10460 [Gimesia maris]